MYKAILSKLKKAQSNVTIGVNRYPFLATILLLIFANLLMLIVAACLAMSLDRESYTNFFFTLVQVAEWLVIPGAALIPKNLVIRALSVIVFMIGLVMFSGVIIAMTTTKVRSFMLTKAEATGRLKLNYHYIILNYNDKVPALLMDMMHNDVDDTVLILSNKNKQFLDKIIKHQTKQRIQRPTSKVNLIVRSGNPHSVAELADICLSQCKAVLIVHDQRDIEKDSVDLDVLQLLLTVSSQEMSKESHIVVETQSFKMRQVMYDMQNAIPSLMCKKISSYSYDKLLGQFLATSILRPNLTSVLYDLLSFVDFSIYDSDRAQPLEDYLVKFTDSVPIYSANGKTFAIAQSQKALFSQRSNLLKIDRRLVPIAYICNQEIVYYILGDNNKYQFMMQSIKKTNPKAICRSYKYEELNKFVKDLHEPKRRTAVVLSDMQSDDNVILALIELNKHFGLNPPFEIVAEIKDPNKQINIEQFNVNSVIVSNKVVSFYALQNMVKKEASWFYETLLDHKNGEFNIWSEKAMYIFDFLESQLIFDSYAEFIHAVFFGSQKRMMPIGISGQQGNTFFCFGLDQKREFVLKPSDSLIYIHYS
ncbi:MAG: hypothetical protein LBU60_00050 [Clostridiales bacterium]|jgi:hypothetical protein|nr:hypothetical protein [Clostridiales bacterium]